MENLIKEFNLVVDRMGELQKRKDELTAKIIAATGHDKVGSKTYDCGDYKVTVKTDWLVKVDGKAYEDAGLDVLLGKANPISTKYSYSVDKKKLSICEELLGDSLKQELAKVLTISDAKPYVSIKGVWS